MVLLWTCIGLFFMRVVGQIEVLLIAPSGLPAMQAWYSGLLPYPLLLPSQIAVLMLMCMLAFATRPTAIGTTTRIVRIVRVVRIVHAAAILYFVCMAVRLIIVIRAYGSEYYLHGAIPVAFHWVLALFLLIWARLATRVA
jgi:hypothetical protein